MAAAGDGRAPVRVWGDVVPAAGPDAPGTAPTTAAALATHSAAQLRAALTALEAERGRTRRIRAVIASLGYSVSDATPGAGTDVGADPAAAPLSRSATGSGSAA